MPLHRFDVGTCLLRLCVASVWLYQGLWNKLLSPHGRHAQIVASAPDMFGIPSSVLLIILGLVEVALAGWVLAGITPKMAAVVQTALLVMMNLAGILWARDAIAEPGGMIVQNIAFIALIWVVASRNKLSHDRPD